MPTTYTHIVNQLKKWERKHEVTFDISYTKELLDQYNFDYGDYEFECETIKFRCSGGISDYSIYCKFKRGCFNYSVVIHQKYTEIYIKGKPNAIVVYSWSKKMLSITGESVTYGKKLPLIAAWHKPNYITVMQGWIQAYRGQWKDMPKLARGYLYHINNAMSTFTHAEVHLPGRDIRRIALRHNNWYNFDDNFASFGVYASGNYAYYPREEALIYADKKGQFCVIFYRYGCIKKIGQPCYYSYCYYEYQPDERHVHKITLPLVGWVIYVSDWELNMVNLGAFLH